MFEIICCSDLLVLDASLNTFRLCVCAPHLLASWLRLWAIAVNTPLIHRNICGE